MLSLESREITIFAMANLTESRDQETGQHLDAFRSYAELLARRLMELPKFKRIINDKFVRLVYETSPLHDIGKVAIPDNILRKPAKLSKEEFAVMQRHTTLGKATLDLRWRSIPTRSFCDLRATLWPVTTSALTARDTRTVWRAKRSLFVRKLYRSPTFTMR